MTFNGSASKDPDGTIAKYEWDLDGNGTYETNTGTTATTSLKYATATEPVVGLRVTDNRGATGDHDQSTGRARPLQQRGQRDLGPDRLLAPRRALRHEPQRHRSAAATRPR